MLTVFAVYGQRGNPFEIKDRLEAIYSGEAEVDIDEAITTPTESEETITDDSEINEENSSEEAAPFIAGSNPFDVDHVPIRRSQLREKSAFEQKQSAGKQRVKSPKAATNIIPLEQQSSNSLLTFIVAIISLVLIAIVANTRRSLFGKISKSFLNDNLMKLTQREENGGLNGAFVILYVIFALNMATFCYLVVKNFNGGKSLPWLYFLLGVVGIYLIRHSLMKILGLTFPVERESSQYNFMIAIFNVIVGMVLIPLNLIIAYATDSLSVAAIYGGLGIVAFIYIVRYMKGFLIGMMSISRSLFHFLLYLCTFEIVPVLLFYKIITSFGSVS